MAPTLALAPLNRLSKTNPLDICLMQYISKGFTLETCKCYF